MSFWRDESGQDLIEYALLCALVALGAVAGLQVLASEVNAAMSRIGSKLASLVAGADHGHD